MNIHKILWPQDRIDHIARHKVEPEEVEEVCFSRPLVLGAKSRGDNPVYHVLGQTEAGRYLFCVLIAFADGHGYPVTVRPMTQSERRRFQDWRSR